MNQPIKCHGRTDQALWDDPRVAVYEHERFWVYGNLQPCKTSVIVKDGA